VAAADEVRAFVALELDAALNAYLARVIEDLRPRLPGVRFSPAGNAHLTLRFLGPSRPAALERIAEAVAPAAAGCPAAEVPLAGLGLFPSHGSPRVLWLGLDLPQGMFGLQAACERAARAAGFEPEPRPFRPHLTLGRFRDRAARPTLPEVEQRSARIERLVIFRSELKPTGAVHTPLHVLPLGTRDAHGAAILPPLP
jgi:2'-5' RNA ligase